MKRMVLTTATVALLATSITPWGDASGPFNQRLSQNQQMVQALSRLTFGPRPGDAEEIRRLGVAKWIELQLHPDQIPENPALAAKLEPLETLRMGLPEIVKQYTQQPQAMMMMQAQSARSVNNLLSPDDMNKVRNGTAEERTAVLRAMDPDKRRQLLATLSPTVLKYTPEFKQEGEDAQKARREELDKERRRLNPPLNDLLTTDQIEITRSGNKDQLVALFTQLDPEKRPLVAATLSPQQLAGLPEIRREGQIHRMPQLVASEDFKEAKVLRAVYSNRQLEEVLVDFWFNHFNVDQAKNVPRMNNQVHLLIGSYERDAIRPHVFGHFKDLLLATARHPAMLYYLDNWESMSPEATEVGPFAPPRGVANGISNSVLPSPLARIAHGLNENYAREVMELHTLGVNGGYTQEDVIAVARCFTGWTVRDPTHPEFVFAPFMHDFGGKTVLGHKIAAGGGEQDGLQIIDILAHHPSTARFISRELAQRFVADDPPQALVDRMARTFMKTDGDLRAVLKTMFTSPEFMSEGAWQTKVKSPFEMVVSAVRAMGGETSDAFALVQKVADLGEPLYNKLEPNGYPNTGDAWLSTSGLMGRMNFSAALALGRVPGVKPDPALLAGKDPYEIARDLLGRDASPQMQAALKNDHEASEPAPPFIAGLVLGSPDFQRR